MRLYIEVDYDDDPREDIGAVARALADDLLELDGVSAVRVHGPEATLIPSPSRDVIEVREED